MHSSTIDTMDNLDIKTQPPAGEHELHATPHKKGGVMNKLYPPGPQPGAKGRVKNHCRKFWWCGQSKNSQTLC
jgi:hypothetical protein